MTSIITPQSRGVHLEPYLDHWNRITPEDMRRIKLSMALAHTKSPNRKIPVSLAPVLWLTRKDI